MRLPCKRIVAVGSLAGLLLFMAAYNGVAQDRPRRPRAGQQPAQPAAPATTPPAARAERADAVQQAQTVQPPTGDRPETQFNDHDRAMTAALSKPASIDPSLAEQPEAGRMTGFDFYKDPLNAAKPGTTFAEIMAADVAQREPVMVRQRQLLEARYNLTPRTNPELRMTRGKLIPLGPTARLRDGVTWDSLAGLTPPQMLEQRAFPYPALPHPKQVAGGQVFPKMQIDMFPRLQRFDVEFDLPDAFIPEFPPAIFLANRPELGDVSRGQVVSINNYYPLFKDLLTPVQLDGLRLLLTPLPQEEFNPTDDRKTEQPSLGVTCFDCHVNGHTTAQFHLNPDTRPQERRLRLDTVSLRGVAQQQIHGSKRSLRSIEDFTEFEQRTAYFNGDAIHAMKKGMAILDRIQVSHMAQMQNMLDFPPAPKLNREGRLNPALANESELRGEGLFFGKARCAECHPAPFYIDHQLHDLQVERFSGEAPPGVIKTFTLRGIKESPPYMHDGRCLTLEDTVEFFNIVLELRLNTAEKQDLTAFLHCL
ncbi:MAG: cytochrome B6 [Planctomycetia bacterium]|nr:cytochrome B6 [Planctomycetia bacterium]